MSVGAKWSNGLVLVLAWILVATACGGDGDSGGSASVDDLSVAWVQASTEGYEVRLLVDGECPLILVDDEELAAGVRAEPGGEFDATTCAVLLPDDAAEIRVEGSALPAPVANPGRVVIVGDTGCRLSDKHGQYQACGDPDAWPFAAVAQSIATADPDLIVHLGDYVYRESPCPDGNEGCAGSPWGQNLETWVTDYFDPSAPLRAAAPVVHVRGNHEDCSRGGEGWFRFFAPGGRPDDCDDLTDPWTVAVGDVQLGIMDTATVEDDDDDELVDSYRSQLDMLEGVLGQDSWIVTHRPFWSVSMNDDGTDVAVDTPTLFDAGGPPPQVALAVGGHVHLAEVIELADGRTPQLVAGNGSTRLLDPLDQDLVGSEIAGTTISDGWQLYEFGFVIADRTDFGWTLAFVDVAGEPLRTCTLEGTDLTC